MSGMIYGIAGKDGNIVYVGQTINPQKRFEVYLYPSSCHNLLLKDWLKSNEWQIVILELNPRDINESEKYFIQKYKVQLFNLSSGGEYPYLHQMRKAWMAKQGIKCPSDLLLNFLMNRKYKRYKWIKDVVTNSRKKMSEFERVMFEIGLAKEYYHRFRELIEKWLYYTEDRIMIVLESNK